jgi:hypothetical protein
MARLEPMTRRHGMAEFWAVQWAFAHKRAQVAKRQALLQGLLQQEENYDSSTK